MAALLFLAIVIPAAVEALHVASGAGEIAVRKGEAARIAQRVLNESIVMTNWNSGMQNGTIAEGSQEFRWTLDNEDWQPQGAMKQLTAQVTFSVQGRDYSLKMSTLAGPQPQSAPTTGITP